MSRLIAVAVSRAGAGSRTRAAFRRFRSTRREKTTHMMDTAINVMLAAVTRLSLRTLSVLRARAKSMSRLSSGPLTIGK